MAQQVADGITWIEGSRTNAYLVVDGDEVCLVDTGYPGDFPRIVAALEDSRRTLADVSAVLLTHGHVDHVGSAERIRRDHDATVFAHEVEAAQVRGDVEERISNGFMIGHLWWPKMLSFLWNVITAQALKTEPVAEVSVFNAASDALDLPGRPVPVFTPGHTSGHCGFHFPQRGVLITGDGLVTHDSLTQEVGPRLLHDAFNHNQAQAVASLDRFRPLDADTVLPGHGAPFRGSPSEAVALTLSRLS